MKIVFVTPAWGRVELSQIVFAQRASAIDSLADAGIVAQQVVVGSDENIGAAKAFGFETTYCSNFFLGMKFNHGYEVARELGATHVVPVGSDSFLDPEFLLDLPDDRVVASRNYAMIREDGKERQHLQMTAVSYAIPSAFLHEVSWRPIESWRKRGCDTSTLDRVSAYGDRLEYRESHPLETVSFRTSGNQVSDYEGYWSVWGIARTQSRVFEDLFYFYPDQLVRQVQALYDRRSSQ